MKKNNISDFVASSMDAVLKSSEHKSLFNGQYKIASSSEEHSGEEHSSDDKSTDDHFAWDSDDKAYADSCPTCKKDKDNCYCDADDANHADYAHDSKMSTAEALNVAIDGLLTASAALDAIGLNDGSTVSLKLASLVVQAKKEMTSADKKKLVKQLQKGKKDKKPSSKKPSSKKPSSSSSSKTTKKA